MADLLARQPADTEEVPNARDKVALARGTGEAKE
jgi:hypothetical protein